MRGGAAWPGESGAGAGVWARSQGGVGSFAPARSATDDGEAVFPAARVARGGRWPLAVRSVPA
eukprot:8998950-Pyramimonas_sp.AAC.1